MIDIHSHILPGMDDGARSMEQSLKMFRMARQEGITSIITTPPNYGHRQSIAPHKIREQIVKVQKELENNDISIQIYSGNEIYYRQGVEEELEKGNINTLAESSYVLVEFHPGEDFHYILHGLNHLKRYGYSPILAHAERYDNLYLKKGRMEELKNSGVQLQINASSITAKGLMDIYKKRAFMLVKEQMADYVATDAHSDGHRAPLILTCEKILQKKAGHEYTTKLLIENAEHILQQGKKIT